MTFRFGVWSFEICIRVVFFGSFDKLCVCERRWITSTRWVLQCFWYICVRVQFKSDINNVTKDVVFYNDLHNFSYASISSPANPPRHPITDKLRTTVSQPSVWLPMRHMDWVQKWKYIDMRCFLHDSVNSSSDVFFTECLILYCFFSGFQYARKAWNQVAKSMDFMFCVFLQYFCSTDLPSQPSKAYYNQAPKINIRTARWG